MKSQKRKSIPHHIDVTRETREIVLNNNYEVRIKIDGAPIRIGKTEHGEKFIETSRSGIITDPEQFVQYADKRMLTGISRTRAFHYANMFSDILESGLYDLFSDGLKYHFEVLNKNFGYCVDDGMFSFVSLPLPERLFPKNLTLYSHFTYDILTGYSTSSLEIRDTLIDVELDQEFCFQNLVHQHPELSFHEGVVVLCGDICFKVVNPIYTQIRGFV